VADSRPRGARAALAATLAAALAAGCAVGPDYHKPQAEVPPAWQPEAPWHEAAPNDTALKGEWWQLFQDDALNPLVERALAGNQDLRVAALRLEQAQDQVTVARSALYPWVGSVRRCGPRQDLGESAAQPVWDVEPVHGAK
jgi:multidrug efflux system outer membrane protein